MTSNANSPSDPQAIARLIDHTLLKPEATPAQIDQLVAEAREYRFASVCVNPSYVPQCADALRDIDDVAVCTVIGFPLGATLTDAKAFEARRVIEQGATEVDMVLPVGQLKAGQQGIVQADIAAVVAVAHEMGALCKVIIETALLTDDEKVLACQLAQAAGADFAKTSTGFSSGGATVEDVALMRRTVGAALGVKASGGVRSLADLQRMVAAGANRIGASAGVRIVQEARGVDSASETSEGY